MQHSLESQVASAAVFWCLGLGVFLPKPLGDTLCRPAAIWTANCLVLLLVRWSDGIPFRSLRYAL